MQLIKKFVATGLAAIMAGSTLAMGALAANKLSDYPTFLAKAGTLDAWVVVGSTAKTSDVVGAVDLAVRLAEVQKTTSKVSTAATAASVDGLEKDGIGLCTATTGSTTCTLANEGPSGANNPFPNTGATTTSAGNILMKNFHYTGLKDSTFSWKSNDYDYREQVDVSGVTMRHGIAVTSVNGTEKMVVEDVDIIYEFVFEENLDLSSATTTVNVGTIANPQYSSPINIKMLGKDFTIVGIGSNSIKMLAGSSGTATATSAVKYGDYSIYSDQGSNNAWARLIVKDKDGNTVDTLIIDDPDASSATTSKDSSAASLTIKVTGVRALQDGTVIGTDVVVGAIGAVEKTYTTDCSRTPTTGTESKLFPGETDWCIRVGSGTFGTAGNISASTPDKIQVVYKPLETVYIKAGEKISLPNKYADLGFEGFNTDKFVTVTVKALSSTVTAYNNSADTQSFGSLNGIEISADPKGSVGSAAGNYYDKAYILYNKTAGTETRTRGGLPVFIGFYDSGKQKIIINGTLIVDPVATFAGSQEYISKYLNISVGTGVSSSPHLLYLPYSFRISYSGAGETSFQLNVSAGTGEQTGNLINMSMNRLGDSAGYTTSLGFMNKTVSTTDTAATFRLGTTDASADTYEINITDEGAANTNAGSKNQDVVVDSGAQLLSTGTNAGSNQVKIKVPSKNLAAKAYFGKLGEATTTSEVTTEKFTGVTTALAKLDTEVTDKTAKNLVLVGGPCVNTLVADLATSGKFDYTCANWPARNFGMIKVIDDAFATGKVALVVAGTRSDDTRTAATVLQQYDTLLKGKNVTAVEVTAATAAGIKNL